MLVYKQWIYAPNKKSTHKAVVGMLQYIAMRDGVELNNFEKELDDIQNNKYVDYIATRKGVDTQSLEHGLFGKYKNMREQKNIKNLDLASEYVKNIAKEKTTIYNAVISLKEEDAVAKGYDKRWAWEDMIKENIYSIAKKMNIPYGNIEYFCAVHMEKGHPHLHLMYWDKNQKIVKSYINPELSNNIRKALTASIFKEELKEIVKEKDKSFKEISEKLKEDDFILKSSSNIFKGFNLNEIYKLSKVINHKANKILNRKIPGNQIDLISKDLLGIYRQIKKEYPKGALKYKYIPGSVKETLDKLSYKIIKENKDIKKEYLSYIKSAKEQASIYGGKENIKEYTNKAKQQIYKYIGNQILKNINGIKELDKQAIISKYRIQCILSDILNVISSENSKSLNNNSLNKEMSVAQRKELDRINRDKRRF